jgi:hypothetical protein
LFASSAGNIDVCSCSEETTPAGASQGFRQDEGDLDRCDIVVVNAHGCMSSRASVTAATAERMAAVFGVLAD